MTVPPGISPDAVIDLDHHADDFNLNEVERSGELRRKCPVAWNTAYGGFWFVTGYHEVSQSARDAVTFAHKFEPNSSDGIDYYGESGIPRPEGLPALGVGEVDGPYHEALRRSFLPFFTPRAIEGLRPFMRQSADWFIDQKISLGQMDLVLDYASPVPALLTMKMMGLPYGNWKQYSNFFHATISCHPDSAEYQSALAQLPDMMTEVMTFIAERRKEPSDDLTSFLVELEIEGQRLTDAQLFDVLWNLIGGGVDTTTSLTSLSLAHLATHPELRQQLSDNPKLYRTASDEFLRYFSVNQQLSRTVTQDTVLGGQQLRKNDRVLVSWLAANHDESVFERPEDVVLDRRPNHHVGFGLGPHRCIGSHLAKTMFEVMVERVLTRLPDYQVELADVDQYLGNPCMTGLNRLPATFTPGTPLDTPRPF